MKGKSYAVQLFLTSMLVKLSIVLNSVLKCLLALHHNVVPALLPENNRPHHSEQSLNIMNVISEEWAFSFMYMYYVVLIWKL